MNKKLIIGSCVLMAMAVVSWFSLTQKQNGQIGGNDLFMANVEALTTNDVTNSCLDCKYTPEPQPCSITVSAEIAAKVFGIKVAQADGTVTVPINGVHECRGGGEMTCLPVRCIEMVQVYMQLINNSH